MCDNVSTGQLERGSRSRSNRTVTSLCVNALGLIDHINNFTLIQSKGRLLRRFPAFTDISS